LSAVAASTPFAYQAILFFHRIPIERSNQYQRTLLIRRSFLSETHPTAFTSPAVATYPAFHIRPREELSASIH
jgi:hypothetical protein